MKHLQQYGFKVFPVNPSIKGEKILNENVFEKVSDIQTPIDIINVFRPAHEAANIAKETIKIGAKVLWLQLEIKSEEAKKIVEEKDIIYIEDKCTKIEYEKYFKQ